MARMLASMSSAPLFKLPSGFPPRVPPPSLVLNFFMQDRIFTSVNESVFLRVPPAPEVRGSAESLFGAIAVFDNSLTTEPEDTSAEVGRGRGLDVFDNNGADNTPGLEFSWTADFNEASGLGGSTLVYKGYDHFPDKLRTIAIVGGTGQLALARGYAQVSTHSTIGTVNILKIASYIYLDHWSPPPSA